MYMNMNFIKCVVWNYGKLWKEIKFHLFKNVKCLQKILMKKTRNINFSKINGTCNAGYFCRKWLPLRLVLHEVKWRETMTFSYIDFIVCQVCLYMYNIHTCIKANSEWVLYLWFCWMSVTNFETIWKTKLCHESRMLTRADLKSQQWD